jgi:hypothetical protein
MSEKRNDFQELRELRILRDMYQTRVDSKLDWSEGKKDKSLIKHYQDVLDYIKIKITKLENN